MPCQACGASTVAFAVPVDLRPHAPGTHAALCSRCLRIQPAADGADEPSFEAVHPAFPSGEAGAALAVAVGLLDTLALRRDAIDDCCSYAERAGADALLTLDRLADAADADADADGAIDPHFDVERRRHQLAEMLR